MSESCRIAVIVAQFSSSITDSLLEGCLSTLHREGVDPESLDVYRVPGAFELPQMAQHLARQGRYKAIICLGCVIRGETAHFDFVAGEAAAGIRQVAMEYDLPVILGVITTEDYEQALARAGGRKGNKGAEAAEAAIAMLQLW